MGMYEAMDGGMMDSFNEQGGQPVPTDDPTETSAFRTWFGNSKVVDSKGDPLPVFHGSEAEFSKFDYNYIGDGHDIEGPGFYFTNVKEEAEHYLDDEGKGKIYEVYLRIENPVPLEGEVSREEIEKMVLYSLDIEDEEGLWQMEDKEEYWDTTLSNWGEHPVSAFNAMVDSIVNYNKGPHDAFQTVWADAFGFDRSADYLRGMLKLGYDGVILKEEKSHGGNDHYVVFNPNSIKAVVSENFSEEEDIYKIKDLIKIDPMN